jgi:hypothetical protein
MLSIIGTSYYNSYTVCSILPANNCKVYLGACSEQRAKDAIAVIEKEHPHVKEKNNVVW